MYIEKVPNRNSKPAILLREGRRVDGKVVKRTIATIRVHFFDIFGCTRHNSNKFGFALACTKIRAIRGQKKYFPIIRRQ